MDDDELLEIYNAALNTPHGVEVQTSDPHSFRRRFYAIRAGLRESSDTSLDPLTCRIMGATTIHIVNKGGVNGK